MDWIKALSCFSQQQISAACDQYIRDEPKRRPTPADIRERIMKTRVRPDVGMGRGDKSKLTFDELDLLENQVLPTARRWLHSPELADQGRQTLTYWGES